MSGEWWAVSGYGSDEPQYNEPVPSHTQTAQSADTAIAAVLVVAAAIVIVALVVRKWLRKPAAEYESMGYASHIQQGEAAV